jgi:hypothetical protein
MVTPRFLAPELEISKLHASPLQKMPPDFHPAAQDGHLFGGIQERPWQFKLLIEKGNNKQRF